MALFNFGFLVGKIKILVGMQMKDNYKRHGDSNAINFTSVFLYNSNIWDVLNLLILVFIYNKTFVDS